MTIGEITNRYNAASGTTDRKSTESTKDYTVQDSFVADTEIRFDKGPQNLSKDQIAVLNSLGINAAHVGAGKTPSLVLGADGRMSLQFTDSNASESAAAVSGEETASGPVTWKSIEKTLRQWADFNAVTDDQVSLVKGELKPVLENKGIEFDSFKIKSALNDPTGVSAVDAYGSVCFEFVNGDTTSMRSFSIDSLHEEWNAGRNTPSAAESVSIPRDTPASRRRQMTEDRALEIADAAMKAKGNIDVMPRSISDRDLKEAYELLKNAKDGAAGTRSPQFYYGNELVTISDIRDMAKSIGMLLV